MRRIRTGRVLGTFVAGLALAFGVLGAGAAQASVVAAGQSQPGACYFDQQCIYDSGWMTYGDGGCQADITVGYLPMYNTMTVTVGVHSPYLFAGCTAVATVHFSTFYAAEGQYTGWSNGGFWGYACSETDFTCHAPHADPGTWVYGRTSTGIPTVDDALEVDSIWVSVTT
jgi:hypothetical protein